MKNKTHLPLLAVAAVALVSINAGANTLTPAPVSGSFVPGISISYHVDLTSGHLMANDGFTIFDFGGYTGILGPLPAGWSLLSDAGTSIIAGGPAPAIPDDPALPNLTFIYNGPTVHEEFGMTVFSPFTIGTLGTTLTTEGWSSVDHGLGLPPGGPHDPPYPVTTASGPIAVPASVPRVPDNAATLPLLAFAVAGLLAAARQRISRQYQS